QRLVDAVDLGANLRHALAVFRSQRHQLLPFFFVPPPSHQASGAVKRPAAVSMACAVRNSVASSNGFRFSCSPSGGPSDDNRAGTEMPGRPAILTVTVKMSSRYMAIGSPLFSP